MLQPRQQCSIFRQRSVAQNVNLYRPRRRDFTSMERLNPVIAAEFQKLESFPQAQYSLSWHCMCRSIKTLRRPAQAATREEIAAASLQFVRKVSGFRAPSRANQAAFNQAIDEISRSVEKLLEGVGVDCVTAPAKQEAQPAAAHSPKQ